MLAEAVLCLALNVYHEARGEPLQGRLAVALATRNRVKGEGTTYCWEVFKAKQFSWTADASKLKRWPTGPAWDEAVRVARWTISGGRDFTKGANHFHATSVMPDWAGAMTYVGQWGNHYFYRARPERGILGVSRKIGVFRKRLKLKSIVNQTEAPMKR
jgi:spore germination cell wall hydrolase CwlJ-like protein